MFLTETKLKGAFVLDLDLKTDSRGFFARAFCAKTFDEHGMKSTVVQTNIAYNHKKATVRGMHYQIPPAAETKLVRCVRGAIYDVIVDLRPESPTFLQHFGIELTQDNRKALYIPERFGHGYQTLTDDCEVTYQVGEFYTPGYERGLRYNDPRLGIAWPLPAGEMSEKDRNWKLLDDEQVATIRRETARA